jgi:hypothetical protein
MTTDPSETTSVLVPAGRPHPAKYSRRVLDSLQVILDGELVGRPRSAERLLVVDPFAGTGLIHTLASDSIRTIGVELEAEWAEQHDSTIVGSALELVHLFGEKNGFPYDVDVIATSPCLARDERILTSDLRWVPAGEIKVGDRLTAFEEEPLGIKANGQPNRRRWKFSEVVRSFPDRVECVRVRLEDGTSVVTTPEHPWLANRYSHSSVGARWVPSSDLMSAPFVMRQLNPWVEDRSYDAGWLAGMFDGEGSLSLGVHGAPKLVISQAFGPVTERLDEACCSLDLKLSMIERKKRLAEHHKRLGGYYIGGGFPGIMEALGRVRPVRLLRKWEQLDISTRCLQPTKVRVVSVEPCGPRDIQVIETTSGTYIGEGFLMHNCFGNRMADSHDAKDACKVCAGEGVLIDPVGVSSTCEQCDGSGLSPRNTYRAKLGRAPSEGSAAVLQWGRAYREFHREFVRQCIEVLPPGGLLAVNMKNHIREDRVMQVVEWWLAMMLAFEVDLHSVVRLDSAGNRFGSNGAARVDSEFWLCVRIPRSWSK